MVVIQPMLKNAEKNSQKDVLSVFKIIGKMSSKRYHFMNFAFYILRTYLERELVQKGVFPAKLLRAKLYMMDDSRGL